MDSFPVLMRSTRRARPRGFTLVEMLVVLAIITIITMMIRIRMKNDKPTGEYEDFLTGFILDDSIAWGRPVAAEVLNDGSLLISEDGNNVIYRISYTAPPARS